MARYWNVVFNKECWAYFSDKAEYGAALESSNVKDLKVMWWSDRFGKDFIEDFIREQL